MLCLTRVPSPTQKCLPNIGALIGYSSNQGRRPSTKPHHGRNTYVQCPWPRTILRQHGQCLWSSLPRWQTVCYNTCNIIRWELSATYRNKLHFLWVCGRNYFRNYLDQRYSLWGVLWILPNQAVPVTSDFICQGCYEIHSKHQQGRYQKVAPGDIAYVELRYFGGRWYKSLGLPNAPTSSYVMEYQYTHWYHDISKGRTSMRKQHSINKNEISGKFLLLEGHVPETSNALHGKAYMVFCWGENLAFDPSTMILVDEDLARSYPNLPR